VISHCRTALLIGLGLLAKNKGLSASEVGIDPLLKTLGMPERLIDSFTEIEDLGRRPPFWRQLLDDPERAAAILSKTLETFEWIREEIKTR
jgi:hypothetical protein